MTTDRLRRLRPLLPSLPATTGGDDANQRGTETTLAADAANAPLPPRLAALDAVARERALQANRATEAAAPEPGEDAVAASPPGQDPYIAFALRWWWLLLLGAILGSVAAFGYTQYGPIPFESIAQVQVPAQTTSDPTANSSQARSAATNYAAEATSPQMFSLVSKELEGTLNVSSSELQLMSQDGRLDIRLVKNTNLISITVTDPDPNRARIIANAFAIAFVRDVNSRAATQLDTRGLQLQEQIKMTESRLVVAQLRQREQALQDDLVAQRGLLLQLQLGYQQELQRQAEADRLAAVAGQPVSPQVTETRNEWLRLIRDQIAAMQTTINNLTAQVVDVQNALKTVPGGTDPSVLAAFTTAYSEQLQSLTREFAQVQLSGPGAREPIIRYGVASDPLPASGQKKMLMMGFAAGVGLAIGLGFLFDLLRQRRTGEQVASQSSESITAPKAEPNPEPPVVEAPSMTTQRPPDLVPLPMQGRTTKPNVEWRRAIGE